MINENLVKKLIGEDGVKQMIDKGYIEIIAFAYMRGINIDNVKVDSLDSLFSPN